MQRAYEKADAIESTISAKFLPLWGEYKPFARMESGVVVYNESMETDLIELARTHKAESFVGTLIGSEPFLWAVQGQSRPFDVILPFAPDLPRVAGSVLLPYGMLRKMAVDAISNTLKFCDRLKRLSGLPVYQLLPPPPVVSEGYVMKHAPAGLRDAMRRFGVPHPMIRNKLWRLWVDVACDLASGDDVVVIHPPPGTTDSHGFLLEKYCADAVHANEHYAQLVWRDLPSHIAGGRTQ